MRASGRLSVASLLGFVLALIAATPAAAHKAGVSYSDIDVARAGGGRLAVDYALRLSSHALVPIDRDRDAKISQAELQLQGGLIEKVLKSNIRLARGSSPCRLDLLESSSEAGGAWAVFNFTAACEGTGPLSITYLLLATDAQPGYNLARITTESGYREHIFTSEQTELVLGDAGPGGWFSRLPVGVALSPLFLLVAIASLDPFAAMWLILLLIGGAGGTLGSLLGLSG